MTKHLLHISLSFALTLSLISCAANVAAQEIISYFSPRGGGAVAIINEIKNAKKTIYIAAFQLSHPHISLAITESKRRNVEILIVVDRSQEKSAAQMPARLRSQGISVRTDHVEKLQHNKYAIIDGLTVITGSFNWSVNAEERNAENLVIIRDRPTADRFTADFLKHYNHSSPFIPKPRSTPPITLRAPLYHPFFPRPN